MFGPKEWDIYEDDQHLSIEYKWFSPIAYFLAFFCTFWFGFLFFWYSIAFGGGAPLVFLLFPLIHVAAGLGLAYYMFCLFLNKTQIDVNNYSLTVNHTPIPWWRGNVDLDITEIKQLYVKQKVSNNKNGTQVSYQIRAKLNGGKDVAITTGGTLPSEKALDLEERLERFLGIDDQPVKGEYGKTNAVNKEARRQRRSTQQSNLFYQINKGDTFRYQSESLDVTHVSQYDWKNGESDRLVQALDKNKSDYLFYSQVNKGLIQLFKEKELTLLEANTIHFSNTNPPNQIRHQGKEYLLDQFTSGEKFMDSDNPVETDQWIYTNQSDNSHLRIIGNGKMLTYYMGQKIKATEVEKERWERIDLPPLEKEYRKDYGEEDFV